MTLTARIHQNLEDVLFFGPGVLGRHLGRLRRERLAQVRVPSFGPFHVRAGESDMATVRQIFVDRQYDLTVPEALGARFQARYEEMLAQGRTPAIVDAGANVGAATRWFATLFPKAVIGAVEPEPGNAAILRRNVEGLANVTPIEAAIGGDRGFVEVHSVGLGFMSQTERAATGLPIVTIDDVCKTVGSNDLFIVKIDIEGFERDLFASNTGWVDRTFAIFVEPHDWMLPGKMTSRTFQEVLGQHPFELFIRGENLLYVRV